MTSPSNESPPQPVQMSPLRDALPPWTGGGQQLLVKNTFIDIKPSAPDLRRVKSAPVKGGDEGSGSSDDDAPEQTESYEGEGDPSELEPPPEPHSLIRMQTRDTYETAEMWSWAQPGQQQPVYQQQTHMIPMQTAAVPVIMVPVGTGVGFVGLPAPFEASMVQQPLRCAREPNDQPNMASSSGAAGDVESQPPTDASQSSPSPQPQTLTRVFSISRNAFRINWTVDARKLRGNDKQAVSPPFELSFGPGHPSVTFKMMIYPKVSSENKGGASFKKAKGKGSIQLKCEAELEEAAGTLPSKSPLEVVQSSRDLAVQCSIILLPGLHAACRQNRKNGTSTKWWSRSQ